MCVCVCVRVGRGAAAVCLSGNVGVKVVVNMLKHFISIPWADHSETRTGLFQISLQRFNKGLMLTDADIFFFLSCNAFKRLL